MKIEIEADDWYPVFIAYETDSDTLIDIPKEKYAWISRVGTEFNEVQEYLEKLWDNRLKERTK